LSILRGVNYVSGGQLRLKKRCIPGSTMSMLFTADQMDDLHWFFRGFYTKHVAGVQNLSEVGDMLTVIRSVLCTAC
jgi:hypothetical protein